MGTIKIRLEFLILLVAAIIISGIIIWKSLNKTSAYVYRYNGYDLEFRANIIEALKIPVQPSEDAIKDVVLNPNVTKIFIVFADSPDNNLVAANGFEVSSKLSLIFYVKGIKKTIKGQVVDSYNVTPPKDSLYIALIPPALANYTGVVLNDSVVYIAGRSSKEFDLATIKFLLSVMEVKK
jgi:hypothetical protein